MLLFKADSCFSDTYGCLLEEKGSLLQLGLGRNIAWNTSGSLVYLACQWLTTVFVVRLSSDYAAAGELSLAMAVGNIFVPIGLYKIRSYQVSDLDGAYSSGEYVGFRLLTIVFGLIVSFGYSAVTLDQQSLPVVFLYCLYKTVEVFVDVMHGIDQKAGRMDYCGKSMIARGILSLFSFSCVLWLSDSLFFAVLAMSIVSIPFLVVDSYWANQFEPVFPVFKLRKFIALAKECLPAVAGVACCAAVTTVSRQYLASAMGTDLLGIYSSVCAPAAIVQAGALNAYAPLLGSFAEAEAKRSSKMFRSYLFRVLAIVGLVLAASLFFCVVAGDWCLAFLFGESILPYSDLLEWAIVSALATALIGLFSDLSIVKRKMSRNFVANAIPLVVVYPFSVLLVQAFGANGVSMSIFASYLLGCLIILPCLLGIGKNHD